MHKGGNVVLIGMPGAGKSTVGVLLAKHLGLGFVDTDILIQERAGRRLQEIVDGGGYRELRRLEEAGRSSGSSAAGRRDRDRRQRRLQRAGDGAPGPRRDARLPPGGPRAARVSESTTTTAAASRTPRGSLSRRSSRERAPLYERFAEVTVDVDGRTQEEVARAVMSAL